MKIFSAFFLIMLFAFNLIAQEANVFQGTITYNMEALGDLSEAEKAQIEGTVISTYGNGVYKTVTNTLMMNQTQIFYEDSIITLSEVMGQKFAFVMTKEEAESMIPQDGDSADTEEINVNLFNETKEIAGYTCHKAEIEHDDNIIEIFYSKEFILNDFMMEERLKEIKGLPLEYTIQIPEKEDVFIHMIATIVKKKKKVKAKVFSIPADIDIMSFEELKAMMGQ